MMFLYIAIGMILLLTKERKLAIHEFERCTKDYSDEEKFNCLVLVVIAWSFLWLPSYIYEFIKNLTKKD